MFFSKCVKSVGLFLILRIVSELNAEKLQGEEKGIPKVPFNPYLNIPYTATYLRVEYLLLFITDRNSIICSFYNEWGFTWRESYLLRISGWQSRLLICSHAHGRKARVILLYV
jgi:hypothetical protein